MKTYIAGKITGLSNYRELFERAKEELKAMGITDIVSPVDLPHDHDKTWESYMRECLIAMLQCDQIYLMNNYQESRGGDGRGQTGHRAGPYHNLSTINIFPKKKEVTMK